MSEIAFTVWEFVRVMVRLEAAGAADPGGIQARLLAEWQDVWSELDDELARLGEADADAFDALMLEHDLRVDCPEALRPAVVQTLAEIVAEMRAAMPEAEPELRPALAGEAAALESLGRRLGTPLRPPRRPGR